MPASTRGKSKPLMRFVQVSQNVAFGWATRDLAALPGVTENELRVGLGHLDYGQVGATVTGPLVAVVGANAPKPGRATKKLTTGPADSVSTYMGRDRIATAKTFGWRPGKPAAPLRWRNPKPGARTVDIAVYLTNGEIKIHQADPEVATAQRLQDLGLKLVKDVSALNKPRLVRGSNTKPALVEFAIDGGKARLPFSTASVGPGEAIYSSDTYRVVQAEKIEFPAFEVPF